MAPYSLRHIPSLRGIGLSGSLFGHQPSIGLGLRVWWWVLRATCAQAEGCQRYIVQCCCCGGAGAGAGDPPSSRVGNPCPFGVQ